MFKSHELWSNARNITNGEFFNDSSICNLWKELSHKIWSIFLLRSKHSFSPIEVTAYFGASSFTHLAWFTNYKVQHNFHDNWMSIKQKCKSFKFCISEIKVELWHNSAIQELYYWNTKYIFHNDLWRGLSYFVKWSELSNM